MNIEDITIKKLATLSKLEFKEDEVQEIKNNLGEILTFMENMKDISFEDTTTPISNSSVLREDIHIQKEFDDAFYENNKNIENNQFKLPTVL